MAALADAFLALGHDVMRGSRDVAKLADWKATAGAKAQTGTFADAAAFGDVLVLAVTLLPPLPPCAVVPLVVPPEPPDPQAAASAITAASHTSSGVLCRN